MKRVALCVQSQASYEIYNDAITFKSHSIHPLFVNSLWKPLENNVYPAVLQFEWCPPRSVTRNWREEKSKLPPQRRKTLSYIGSGRPSGIPVTVEVLISYDL